MVNFLTCRLRCSCSWQSVLFVDATSQALFKSLSYTFVCPLAISIIRGCDVASSLQVAEIHFCLSFGLLAATIEIALTWLGSDLGSRIRIPMLGTL